jgi:hypothetical protein
MFEELSCLKINFQKSEILCFDKVKEEIDQYKQIFGCDAGSLPFRYQGIPIHYRKLRNSDWYQGRSGLKENWDAGKANYYPMGIDLSLSNKFLLRLSRAIRVFLRRHETTGVA